jgi:hypothetical protein
MRVRDTEINDVLLTLTVEQAGELLGISIAAISCCASVIGVGGHADWAARVGAQGDESASPQRLRAPRCARR